jgi:hypothetical protein
VGAEKLLERRPWRYVGHVRSDWATYYCDLPIVAIFYSLLSGSALCLGFRGLDFVFGSLIHFLFLGWIQIISMTTISVVPVAIKALSVVTVFVQAFLVMPVIIKTLSVVPIRVVTVASKAVSIQAFFIISLAIISVLIISAIVITLLVIAVTIKSV